MAEAQYRKLKQIKEGRLEIVSELYKKGYSVRKIRAEVMARLDLPTYSTFTVHKDIHSLLSEWRESRLQDMDMALQLELERIDDTCRELWEQWEKSKTDYKKTTNKRKGSPSKDMQGGQTLKTYQKEEIETSVVRLGDPSYIAEIRQQLGERRKLLGLYAPEKRNITGDMSFAAFLMQSGMIEEDEEK